MCWIKNCVSLVMLGTLLATTTAKSTPTKTTISAMQLSIANSKNKTDELTDSSRSFEWLHRLHERDRDRENENKNRYYLPPHTYSLPPYGYNQFPYSYQYPYVGNQYGYNQNPSSYSSYYSSTSYPPSTNYPPSSYSPSYTTYYPSLFQSYAASYPPLHPPSYQPSYSSSHRPYKPSSSYKPSRPIYYDYDDKYEQKKSSGQKPISITLIFNSTDPTGKSTTTSVGRMFGGPFNVGHELMSPKDLFKYILS